MLSLLLAWRRYGNVELRHKRGKIVPVTSPDYGKINMLKTNIELPVMWEALTLAWRHYNWHGVVSSIDNCHCFVVIFICILTLYFVFFYPGSAHPGIQWVIKCGCACFPQWQVSWTCWVWWICIRSWWKGCVLSVYPSIFGPLFGVNLKQVPCSERNWESIIFVSSTQNLTQRSLRDLNDILDTQFSS